MKRERYWILRAFRGPWRGMDHDGTAQILSDGMRINYNFIRPNMGLKGKTPAQMARLDLQLEGARWKALIKQAIQSTVRQEGN